MNGDAACYPSLHSVGFSALSISCSFKDTEGHKYKVMAENEA